MSKAWIITNGSYSDYRVMAVVTDPDVAKRFRTWRLTQKSDWDDLDITAVPVWDGETPELLRMLATPPGWIYRIFFDADTHEYVEDARAIGSFGYLWKSGPDSMIDISAVNDPGWWDGVGGTTHVCCVVAQDMDHAIKAAKDLYMQWIAEQEL